MIGYARLLWAVAVFFCAISSASAQTAHSTPLAGPKGTKLEDIEAILTEFIDDVSARKFEEAARSMSVLGNPYDGDQFKKTILGLDIIGKPFYFEKIIDKSYGKTGKDIIFKIATDNNIYFFRFILHQRTEDNWIVTWLAIQSEMQAPLPRVWSYMNP